MVKKQTFCIQLENILPQIRKFSPSNSNVHQRNQCNIIALYNAPEIISPDNTVASGRRVRSLASCTTNSKPLDGCGLLHGQQRCMKRPLTHDYYAPVYATLLDKTLLMSTGTENLNTSNCTLFSKLKKPRT